jgi:hypothetical protein
MSWKKFVTIGCSIATMIISVIVAGVIGSLASKGGIEKGWGLEKSACIGILVAEIIAAILCLGTAVIPCINDSSSHGNYV